MADDLNINIGANPAGIEAGSRRAKVALKGVADGGKDLDAALRRLRSSIDPTYVAMEKYNRVHAENLQLLRAGLVTRREYNQAMKVAKAAMEEETAAIQRNSAEGRAAIAAQRQAKAQALAESRAAAAEEARLAREEAAARRTAAREAAAEAKRLKAEERAATRQAAAEAKAAAREEAAAIRTAKREEAAAAREAAREATAAARQKAREEREAAREVAAADKAARREQREAAREAARIASAAAKEAAAAKRQEATAAKEAAAAARDQARAERDDAQALQQFRSSLDPTVAAQTRYNTTMQRATALLMANKLQQGEWNAIQKQARAQMDLNVRSLGRQNAMYVQLGYQAQDVTASLASGINPLVILAQQGGQTAAALSTMGGTAGRVAAFFAGPWGAAIIGATMLLGYLWESQSAGEKSTKDLMDATDRHKMSVQELSTALQEYIKTQREANQTALEGVTAQAAATMSARQEIIDRMTAAQVRLTDAQKAYDIALKASGQGALGMAAVGAAAINLQLAKRAVDGLKDAYQEAVAASAEARAAYVQQTTTMTELEKREQMEQQALYGAFIRDFTAAGNDVALQTAATTRYQKELTASVERYKKAKEEERDAHRENAAAVREEGKAYFKSREDAIGLAGRELRKEGYNVGENFQFGKVGNHPGMGRQAHGKYAIDINIPGFGAGNPEAANDVARRRMDEMVAAYQARGFRVLWNGKVYKPYGQGASYDIPAAQNQHRDHAHMEAPASIVGKPAGSSLADSLVSDAAAIAAEERRIREEAVRDHVAQIAFDQELNQEDIAQVIALQKEKIAVLTEFYGATSKEVMDAGRDQIRMERQLQREVLEQQRAGLNQRLQLAEEAQNREAEIAARRRDMAGGVVDFAESNGIIGARQALIEKAAILDQEYADQVEHENRMFNLKAENIRAQIALENLPKKVKEELNRELERAEAEHQSRMLAIQGEYAKNAQGVYLASANITMQKWKDVASTLSGSMTSAFQGIWTHSQTLQQGFINAADQMVYKFVDAGAKMFEEWFMRQVGMTTVQTAQEGVRTASTVAAQGAQTAAVATGTTAQTAIKAGAAATEQGIQMATAGAAVAAEGIKTAAAVTGAATQTSVGAAAGMAEIGTRAATSAAGAFSSTVVIPFIGPVAAPVAAAAALAAVLGFGALISARGGQGEVPEDGQLSVLHKKEMVLPAQFAVPLRQMLVSPRASNGLMSAASAAATTTRDAAAQTNSAINFHYQPRHTNMGAGFDELLRKDSRSLRKWIKNEVRNGGLKLS